MKQIFRAVTMLSLFFVLAASAVFAQAERRVVIRIPFDFTVGQKTLPAGAYRIEPNRIDSDRVWVIKSVERRESAVLMTISVRANATQEEGKVIFHKYGDQYFLSQIWTPGSNTGSELPISRQERAVELASAKERQTFVLAIRGE